MNFNEFMWLVVACYGVPFLVGVGWLAWQLGLAAKGHGPSMPWRQLP